MALFICFSQQKASQLCKTQSRNGTDLLFRSKSRASPMTGVIWAKERKVGGFRNGGGTTGRSLKVKLQTIFWGYHTLVGQTVMLQKMWSDSKMVSSLTASSLSSVWVDLMSAFLSHRKPTEHFPVTTLLLVPNHLDETLLNDGLTISPLPTPLSQNSLLSLSSPSSPTLSLHCIVCFWLTTP